MPSRNYQIKKTEFDGYKKICLNCKIKKPLLEFYQSKDGLGGVHSTCKKCKRLKENERYRKTKFKNFYAKFELTKTHRTCSDCYQNKPLSHFGYHPTAGQNTISKCKDCISIRNKKKSKFSSFSDFAKKRVEYDELKKTKRCRGECKNIKSLSDFGLFKKGVGGRHAQCRNCKKKYFEDPFGRAIKLFDAAKRRAKDKKREFSISVEWIKNKLMNGKCELTGINFVMKLNEKNFKNHHPYSPSIDRIDNNKGYTEENCQIIVFALNAGKSDFKFDDCIKLAKALIIQV